MLIYLNDKYMGRHYLVYDFGAPNAPHPPPPPPDATILNNMIQREHL